MIRLAKRIIAKSLRSMGYQLTRVDRAGRPRAFPEDFDEPVKDLWNFVSPFTMTSKERVFALRQSVEYVIQNHIAGAIVECGVWKGGSMMAIAATLLQSNVADRELYLFDTFEGMPEPTSDDIDLNEHAGARAFDDTGRQLPGRASGGKEEFAVNWLSAG